MKYEDQLFSRIKHLQGVTKKWFVHVLNCNSCHPGLSEEGTKIWREMMWQRGLTDSTGIFLAAMLKDLHREAEDTILRLKMAVEDLHAGCFDEDIKLHYSNLANSIREERAGKAGEKDYEWEVGHDE